MKIQKRLAVSLFTAVMTLSSCSLLTASQKGYERIKEDIKSSMISPSSYKCEGVECYYYVQTAVYPYQYKIDYSGENIFGVRLNVTVYYGYSSGLDVAKSYGSDSSYFDSAKLNGKKESIIAS